MNTKRNRQLAQGDGVPVGLWPGSDVPAIVGVLDALRGENGERFPEVVLEVGRR
jgi:hypothetical protein